MPWVNLHALSGMEINHKAFSRPACKSRAKKRPLQACFPVLWPFSGEERSYQQMKKMPLARVEPPPCSLWDLVPNHMAAPICLHTEENLGNQFYRYLLPITCFLLPITYFVALPVTHYLLPILLHRLLPITYCRQASAFMILTALYLIYKNFMARASKCSPVQRKGKEGWKGPWVLR